MDIKLGLKENWKQFTLLVIINGFVGGMVGLERSILPQIAEYEFVVVSAHNSSSSQFNKLNLPISIRIESSSGSSLEL